MLNLKICGLTRKDDLELAVSSGAQAIGFIGFKKSPRFVDVDQVKELCNLIPKGVKKVLVTVDDSLEKIAEYIAVGVDVVQLHGPADFHTAEFAQAIEGTEIWRAIRLKDVSEIEENKDYPCSSFVIDSFVKDSTIPGGTGHLANWELSKQFVEAVDKPVYLAGGISAENILEAHREVAPAAFDLSSSVEISPGIKSAEKIKELFKVINNA